MNYDEIKSLRELEAAACECRGPMVQDGSSFTCDRCHSLRTALYSHAPALLDAAEELNRREGSPVTRLHNICELIGDEADRSAFSREEWDAVDKEGNRLRREVKALRAQLAASEKRGAEARERLRAQRSGIMFADNDNAKTTYTTAWEKWGAESQICMLHEEMAELVVAISRWGRGRAGLLPVAEEIADVAVMLEQISFGLDVLGEVKAQHALKLARLTAMLGGPKP